MQQVKAATPPFRNEMPARAKEMAPNNLLHRPLPEICKVNFVYRKTVTNARQQQQQH